MSFPEAQKQKQLTLLTGRQVKNLPSCSVLCTAGAGVSSFAEKSADRFFAPHTLPGPEPVF